MVQVLSFALHRRIQTVVAFRQQHQFLESSGANLTNPAGQFGGLFVGQLLAILDADARQLRHRRRIHRHRRHHQRPEHITFTGFIGADPAGLVTGQILEAIGFVRRSPWRRRAPEQAFHRLLQRAGLAGDHQRESLLAFVQRDRERSFAIGHLDPQTIGNRFFRPRPQSGLLDLRFKPLDIFGEGIHRFKALHAFNAA